MAKVVDKSRWDFVRRSFGPQSLKGTRITFQFQPTSQNLLPIGLIIISDTCGPLIFTHKPYQQPYLITPLFH